MSVFSEDGGGAKTLNRHADSAKFKAIGLRERRAASRASDGAQPRCAWSKLRMPKY